MQSTAATVDEYMKTLPSERLAAITKLRQLCLTTLSGYEESMAYGGHHIARMTVLGAVIDEQPKLLAMVTPDIIERGISAVDIIREIAPAINSNGGGRPNMATAGGKDPDGLDKALEMVSQFVGGKLGA